MGLVTEICHSTFTLGARHANGGPSSRLPFGFENFNAGDGYNRGELGFTTMLAFHIGKLINGNFAFGSHVNKIRRQWTSLRSLKTQEPRTFFDLIAISNPSGGRPHHFIEFVQAGKLTSSSIQFSRVLTDGFWLKDEIFGAYETKHGQPVFIGPARGKQYHTFPIWLSHLHTLC